LHGAILNNKAIKNIIKEQKGDEKYICIKISRRYYLRVFKQANGFRGMEIST